MLDRLEKHIAQFFFQGKKLLLAVSGGVDSMVMLHLFHKLGVDIGVAHCNFRLRGEESDLDENLVREFCKNNQIPLFVEQFDTEQYALEHKKSIQMSARELRYKWFDDLMNSHKYEYLLTAHHLDDQVETFMINLIRGTGIDGLLGIPEKQGNIVRPMLIFSKEEILNYAHKNSIEWREDASNQSSKYLRNKIRHHIIPVLKQENTSFLTSFLQTIHHLKSSKLLIKDAVEYFEKKVCKHHSDESIVFDIEKLKLFENYQHYLYPILCKYGFTAWRDVEKIMNLQTGKQIFSEKYSLLKNRNSLVLQKKKDKQQQNNFKVNSLKELHNLPINLTFEPAQSNQLPQMEKNTIVVDADLLCFPLTIRKPEAGERFSPKGMKGSKKLSKFFKDEKLSLFEKENIWLLVNGDGRLIWVINHRADNYFSITNKTKNFLIIKTSV